MNNKSKWDSLTLKEKSEIMKMAISSGVRDLNNIKQTYNSFAEGGYMLDEEPVKIERVRESDIKSTKERTERMEEGMARIHRNKVKVANAAGHPSDPYFIPYVNEIHIPGVGRTAVSILDSIAVNARRANIPLEEAYGLAAEETVLGATPSSSMKAYVENFERKYGRKPTQEELQATERALMNTSYSRNYGGIHPQFLINNHEWTTRGWEESQKYKSILGNIKSPLEHGFKLFKLGLYNQGDPNHTKKVREKGKQIMSTPAFQEYMKKSKFHNNSK